MLQERFGKVDLEQPVLLHRLTDEDAEFVENL